MKVATPIDRARSGYRPALRHAGPCGRRIACYKVECRQRFAGYLSVEILPSGIAIAYCHGAILLASDPLLRIAA